MLAYDTDMSIWVIPLGWLLLHSQIDVTGKLTNLRVYWK